MYRKFTANQIFTGHQLLPKPAVLITDMEGVIIDLVDFSEAGEGIVELNGMLTPGFVNAHCHVELSHLKGRIPENTGLVDFVQQVMHSRGLNAELKQDAMKRAETEMYEGGIVAVGDICNTTDSIAIKKNSTLLWHNFIEVSGFTDAVAQQRLDDARLVYNQFKTNLPNHATTFSPHAPYSVSKKLFQLLNDQTEGEIITIHNQECKAEDLLYIDKTGPFLQLYKNIGIDASSFKSTGQSSFRSWLPYFTHNQSIISVHNTFTSKEDIDFNTAYPGRVKNLFSYCICINANQYIERSNPPIELLKKSGFNIIIGTDSYASNQQLNILEELKTLQQHFQSTIPLEQLLQWATLNGGKALKLDQVTGSFDKGKKPGLVLIQGLQNQHIKTGCTVKRIL